MAAHRGSDQREIFTTNPAILRSRLRMRNRQIPSVGNTVQSSETMRNSLGLNYKSAALEPLSYAAFPIRKLFLASCQCEKGHPGGGPSLTVLRGGSQKFPLPVTTSCW